MTEIYMIRHAEAEGNLYRRGQGQFDGRITVNGEKQIAALAERFKDIKIDALYSSDLRRTQTTAGAILKYHPHLKLGTEPRLREICMGVWEDKSWGDLAYHYAEQLTYFNNEPEKWSVEGAESFGNLTERILGVVRELAQRHDGQTIVLISHGMAIRSLISAILQADKKDAALAAHGDNTAVSLLGYENGKFSVEYFNDNSHVPPELSTFARQTWWREKSGIDHRSLRFEPVDFETDTELYMQCYADTWRIVHGSLAGFVPSAYLDNAKRHQRLHPEAVTKALIGDEPAGIVDVDLERTAKYGAGWVSLCMLSEEFRNQNLGIQLIGQAASVSRRSGMKLLRLHVSGRNEKARGFYLRYGFREINRRRTFSGNTQILLEYEI